MHTVVELDSFVRDCKAIMSDNERVNIINYLATHPGTGVDLGAGLRKVRIARPGSGKSGGYRTIYVFAGDKVPLFAITVFAKNEKANLNPAERAALVVLSKQLVSNYGGGNG